VDILAAHSTRIHPLHSSAFKTTIIWRSNRSFFSHCFIRMNPQNPWPDFSSHAPKILN
jgi:hypothetical protein